MADYDVNLNSYYRTLLGDFKVDSIFISYDYSTDFATWANGIPNTIPIFTNDRIQWMIDNGCADIIKYNEPNIPRSNFLPFYELNETQNVGFALRIHENENGTMYVEQILLGVYLKTNPNNVASGYTCFQGEVYINQDYDVSTRLFPYFLKTSTSGPIYFNVGAIYTNENLPITLDRFELSMGRPNIYAQIPFNLDNFYEEMAPSATSDSTGSYDYTSVDIDFPSLPSISISDTKLARLFSPSIENLQELGEWLFSSSIIDTFVKAWFNPMDLIISVGIVPFKPTITDRANINIGGYDTGIECNTINQYYTVNCGKLNIGEYFGSALDYINTKIHIYLPCVGVRDINVDEVMGGSIEVRYNVDVFSGACIANIKCTRQLLNSVLYTYEGNLLSTLPLVSRDYSSFYATIAKGAVDVLSAQGTNIGDIANTAINVMNSKPNISKSSNISGVGSLMNMRVPFLIIERPIESTPKSYAKLSGYPSNVTFKISDLKGYTEIGDINLSDIPCTSSERNELMNLLNSGVYF